jgi:hypothetical protein
VSAAQKIVPDKLNRKARHVRPGLFEDHFEVSMHGVDNQISATQQKDGNANEQENRHPVPANPIAVVSRINSRFHNRPHNNVRPN